MYQYQHSVTWRDVYGHYADAGFFSWGGTGGVPPSGEKFANPPHLTLVPIFGPRLVPPPAEVRPRKF